MTEETNGAAAAVPPQQQPQIKFQTLAQYIRDMSFENIVARKGSTGNVVPEVKVQVGLDAQKRGDTQYEVSIKLNVDSAMKEGNEKVFLLEIDYVGLFHIEGVPEAQMHPFLMVECPRQIFPFLRRIVSDVTRDGGFAPLNLENIDFLSIYRQELSRRNAQSTPAQA